MKKIIDKRFLLTPFATTIWNLQGGLIKRKYIYIFGFKVADIVIK